MVNLMQKIIETFFHKIKCKYVSQCLNGAVYARKKRISVLNPLLFVPKDFCSPK